MPSSWAKRSRRCAAELVAYSRRADARTLRARADLLANIRDFFATRGVLEVETPVLSSAAVSDPALHSIRAELMSLSTQYLQTSPEFAMKRLLASGIGDCYQICRVFRDGELGRWHQPEFTLLEWYRIDWDERELMTEVEALIGAALAPLTLGERSTHISYADALRTTLGVGPEEPSNSLRRRLERHGTNVPRDLAHDELLDLAMSTQVVPKLEADRLTFILDYPASQAALAEIKPGPPPVAARFEVFARGLELGNGFRELTDADEQRRRFEADLEARRAGGLDAVPIDEDLLAALGHGLAECAGVAVGVDRLLALLVGAEALSEVINFPHD